MLKIILADSQAIFRAGAAKVLAVEDELRIVAQSQDYAQTQMALEKFRPNLVIFAATLHPRIQEVAAACSRAGAKLIVVADNRENTARFSVPGVHGVVFRSITGDALADCVRKVAKGQTVIQSESSAPVAEGAAADDQVGARVRDRLTPKELKIVSLIVQGFKNKEIAAQLGTTEQVIKNYVRNVYDKIGVSDRLELALFTIHHRMLAEAAAASTAPTNN